MGNIKPLSAEDALGWIKASTGTRVIEFYASWCIYHMLTIRKLELLQSHLPQDVQFGSVDVVGHEEAFIAHGVDQIPTISIYHDGNVLRWVGDTDLEAMLEPIRELLAAEAVQ